jgi:hypothetical protein
MTRIRFWSATIFDANAGLPMALWREESGLITLEIDGCDWPLTIEEASDMARAAQALRRAIEIAERDKVTPAPRALIKWNHLNTNAGEVQFHVAIVAEFPYISLTWADTCLLPVPSKRDELLYGLGDKMAEAVQALRGSPVARPFGPDAMVGRPPGQVHSQRPGERWQTWQPQFWRPDGPIGDW